MYMRSYILDIDVKNYIAYIISSIYVANIIITYNQDSKFLTANVTQSKLASKFVNIC